MEKPARTRSDCDAAYQGAELVALKICPECKARLRLTAVQRKQPRTGWVILAQCPNQFCRFHCYVDDPPTTGAPPATKEAP